MKLSSIGFFTIGVVGGVFLRFCGSGDFLVGLVIFAGLLGAFLDWCASHD